MHPKNELTSARVENAKLLWVFWLACLLACLAVVVLSTAAHAAPAVPAAGTLTVNSSADNTISDTVLTLREALYIARGGTGVTGLNRPLSLGEKAQTSGCSFNSNNTISGNCGIHQPDTILFSLGMFDNVITLSSVQLPGVDDDQPTTIDGSGPVSIFIDASGLSANQDGLRLYSTDNIIKHLSVGGASRADFYVAANNNLIQQVAATGAGANGIYLGSNSNTVLSSTVQLNGANGLDISGAFNIVRANTVLSNSGNGLSLHGTAHDNYIGCGVLCISELSGNRISGNIQNGVELTGTSVAFNFLEANVIGLGAQGNTKDPNSSDGVLIFGAHNNTIGDAGARGNNISGNNGAGVRLDFGAHHNSVAGNTIGFGLLGNFNDGVDIQGGAHHNTIGAAGAGLGNLIAFDRFVGVGIVGPNTAYNVVDNNIITGTLSAGVWIDTGAHDNLVGSAANARNTLGQSNGDGVHLQGGAYSNTIGYNYIGLDSAFNALPNGGYGIGVSNAYTNQLGLDLSDGVHNYISNNDEGVQIAGVFARANRLMFNAIAQNTGRGVRLEGGAHDNIIGIPSSGNLIHHNGTGGILVDSLASGNRINANDIYQNSGNGIELSDAGTIDNKFFQDSVHANTLDGINERSSADENAWSQLSVYANGGLGIDKNAANDATNMPSDPFPVVTSVSVNGSLISVSGTATPATANTQVTVELYVVAMDPSGYGEGQVYKGNDLADTNGAWTVTYFSLTPAVCYTAVQTVLSVIASTSVSSEFGPNSCRTFLPVIRR